MFIRRGETERGAGVEFSDSPVAIIIFNNDVQSGIGWESFNIKRAGRVALLFGPKAEYVGPLKKGQFSTDSILRI